MTFDLLLQDLDILRLFCLDKMLLLAASSMVLNRFYKVENILKLFYFLYIFHRLNNMNM